MQKTRGERETHVEHGNQERRQAGEQSASRPETERSEVLVAKEREQRRHDRPEQVVAGEDRSRVHRVALGAVHEATLEEEKDLQHCPFGQRLAC
jgi:hypothetical protein